MPESSSVRSQSLVSLGIRFLSPTNFDRHWGGHYVKFLLHVLAAIAETERGIIRKLVCAGVRAA